ncbi:MAG: DUF2961 domain-containing protein [Planctomycetota bacterium]|nr:MAG: DUF2961 domain-containing protein [Planctomycetota bacterium]
MSGRSALLGIVTISLLLSAASLLMADTVPGPFGILRLPADYESHRSTFRTRINRMQETVVADLEGEGCLRHMWMTIAGVRQKPINGLILTMRIYSDGNEKPDVETPVTPFFGMHHGHLAGTINSPYLQVTNRSGFNCYFPMPYKKGLRITLQSESERIGIWFQADYHKYKTGSLIEPRRFHAAYRRVNRAKNYGKPYHLGHGIGRGVIVGMTLGVRVFDTADAWYHCGGDLVLMDGRTNGAHLLSGIGGEDYFGTAWGQEVFYNRSIGTPYYDVAETPEPDKPLIEFAAYRFFDRDPIAFADSFSYDFGSLANDMSSVLYWYQEGPAISVSRLPPLHDRVPDVLVPDGKYDITLEGGRIWNLCGPFSCKDKNEFDRKEFPEDGIDISQVASANFGQYAEAVTKKLGPPTVTRWKQGVQSVFNFVDLTPHFRSRMRTNAGFPIDVSAYAATIVDSDAAKRIRLRLGHDDWFNLWLNGKLIYEGKEQNGFKTTEIEVNLAKGDNLFMAKAANCENTNFRAWVFLFDLLP